MNVEARREWSCLLRNDRVAVALLNLDFGGSARCSDLVGPPVPWGKRCRLARPPVRGSCGFCWWVLFALDVQYGACVLWCFVQCSVHEPFVSPLWVFVVDVFYDFVAVKILRDTSVDHIPLRWGCCKRVGRRCFRDERCSRQAATITVIAPRNLIRSVML